MADLGPATPILRIFDEARAREFYLDFLGFSVLFEHRFAPDLPLYMGIALSGCTLHLSEHHGDGSPGIHLRVEAGNVEGYRAELAAKAYQFARPGPCTRTDWDTVEFTVTDPFSNRLTFFQVA